MCHYPDQSAQGHTSGAYGKLVNNGEIVLEGGAAYYSYGLTSGKRRNYGAKRLRGVSALCGAQLLRRNQHLRAVQRGTVPLPAVFHRQYSMQAHRQLRRKGNWHGKLVLLGAVTTQNVLVVGYDATPTSPSDPGLIVLKQGAYLTKTYDGTRYVTSSHLLCQHKFRRGRKHRHHKRRRNCGRIQLAGLRLGRNGAALPYTFEMILTKRRVRRELRLQGDAGSNSHGSAGRHPERERGRQPCRVRRAGAIGNERKALRHHGRAGLRRDFRRAAVFTVNGHPQRVRRFWPE